MNNINNLAELLVNIGNYESGMLNKDSFKHIVMNEFNKYFPHQYNGLVQVLDLNISEVM